MFYLNFYLSPHLALALSFHELQSSSNALCWYTFRCKHVNITGPLSKVRKHFLFLALFTLVKGLFAPSYIKWAHNNPGWSFFFFFFRISRSFYLPSNDGQTHTHTCTQQFDAPKTNLFAGDVSPKKSLCSTHRENLCSLYLPQKRLIRFEFHQRTLFAVGSVTVANFILLAS